MFIVENFSLAVVLLVVTMLCWGSWANTQKLASKSWPFQLFYWDYSIGVVVVSLVLGLTLGSYGNEGRSFTNDLIQATGKSIGLALIGGVIFNLANLLLVAAIDVAGMAVAFPLGIGIALVQGVLVNYLSNPKGNVYYLFGGVLLVALAIVINALAYLKLPKSSESSSKKGVLLAVSAGVLMGFFYGFVAESMVTDFKSPETGLMTPYSAMFVFSIGIFGSNFLWNSIFMYKPIKGEAVNYKDYFKRGDIKLHSIGLLGGLIWCLGMLLSLVASGAAGTAISYGLGQGATLVAAIWGVFVWKEFSKAKKQTAPYIAVMFLFFVSGLGLIILAR